MQQKSDEVAEAHARNKETADELRAQAADIAAQQADVADALRSATGMTLHLLVLHDQCLLCVSWLAASS